MRLLTLDPGLIVGYALFDGLRIIDSGQIDNKALYPDVEKVFRKPDFVVLEGFVWTPQVKDAGYRIKTIEGMGAIKYWLLLNHIKFTEVFPATVKKIVPDKKLKELNLWIKGKPHERDAIRLGVYWLKFKLKLKGVITFQN